MKFRVEIDSKTTYIFYVNYFYTLTVTNMAVVRKCEVISNKFNVTFEI
jgi:hypothetical protein